MIECQLVIFDCDGVLIDSERVTNRVFCSILNDLGLNVTLDKIRLTLGKSGLLGRFRERIFSVVDVDKPKPAPDVFLHAACQMGVDPAVCAVIEDTPTGVRAGVAAGMHVFGFCANTPEHRFRQAGAHVVFAEMHFLPGLLQPIAAEPSRPRGEARG